MLLNDVDMMPQLVVIIWTLFFFITIHGFAAAKDTGNVVTTSTQSLTTPLLTTTTNVTCAENGTNCSNSEKDDETVSYNPLVKLYENKKVLMRTFYVLVALTIVVVFYFVVKSVMLRRNKSKSKKYGIISTPGSALEMQPLDQGDDDDDMTLYEAGSHRAK